MPATTFLEHATHIQFLLNKFSASNAIQRFELRVDQRSKFRGFIAGLVVFPGESELHFREFVDLTKTDAKLMYAYHYQNAKNALIFRYDNAAHKPALTQPDHKHTPDEIILCPHPPNLVAVIDEILQEVA
ncbi:MAG: DUF6516 family protein [bacterium]